MVFDANNTFLTTFKVHWVGYKCLWTKLKHSIQCGPYMYPQSGSQTPTRGIKMLIFHNQQIPGCSRVTNTSLYHKSCTSNLCDHENSKL